MEIGTHGLSYVLCIDLLNFTHDLHLNSSVSSSVLLCAVYIQIFFICGTDFISDLSHVISSYNAHVLSEECVKCPDPFVAVCKNVRKHNGNRLHLEFVCCWFFKCYFLQIRKWLHWHSEITEVHFSYKKRKENITVKYRDFYCMRILYPITLQDNRSYVWIT